MTLIGRVLPAQPYGSLRAYLDDGGGRGLEAARRVEPEAVIGELEASGLRGRGGAGFPTGVKWRTVVANRSPLLPATVVVNAAEGEPGTFKDRAILMANPYAVLEGALVAAAAVGADQVTVAAKASAPDVLDRLERAVAEMRDGGMLGDVDVDVVAGPDEYLYGEETALLEVVDGRPPFPRIAPPYRRGVDEVVADDDDVADGSGLSGEVVMAGPGGGTGAPPALVDNVETLANVPAIVADGADRFRAAGTRASPGTIVCTVTGDVRRPGVAELALGTTVREAIDAVGGGPAGPVKAVLNGVSAAPLPADLLDTPLTYEDMADAGSALGTASLIVVREGTDMTAVAAGVARFLAVESCGQCTACKQDGLVLSDALERLCATKAGADDLDVIAEAVTTVADGARCNLAVQQQVVVGAIVRRHTDELAARLAPGSPPIAPMEVAELRSLADGEAEVDHGQREKQPDWTVGGTWAGATPVDRFTDHRRAGDAAEGDAGGGGRTPGP
ncbi:MAG TPA: NADH-ubiquinone oxidoreductase-F iron-sulfur binding region domain-containing protein [Acidimicrobiales bacterium]